MERKRPMTVGAYLAAAPADKRAALRRLRKTVKAAAPKATEAISYGIVGFTYRGKPLLYLGYAKAHCAIYGSIGQFVAAHAAALRGHDLGTGTIRFAAGHPLPDTLVRALVRSRLAEIDKDLRPLSGGVTLAQPGHARASAPRIQRSVSSMT